MTTLIANYSFSFNGQVFGGANSPYQIQNVEGLESLPGIRNQDDNRGYNDGMFSGRDFLAGRTITITFNTFATPGYSAQENYNIIQRALLPQTSGTTPLYFILSNNLVEQVVYARVRGMQTPIDPNYTYGYIISQVEFFCPDPRYYASNVQTADMLYSADLGRTYNKTFDYSYGGGAASITTTIFNAGWAATYPTITINGPITAPIIGNQTENAQMSFSGTYADTDFLVIDLYNKLITLNGAPARNTLISGTWFSAQPGNNEFYFSGTDTQVGTTKAVVTWQSAYI